MSIFSAFVPLMFSSGKNPVMLLNELVPGLQFECTEETGDAKSKIFTMEVELKGRKYQGFGKSKVKIKKLR